jgi:hypothetical protein
MTKHECTEHQAGPKMAKKEILLATKKETPVTSPLSQVLYSRVRINLRFSPKLCAKSKCSRAYSKVPVLNMFLKYLHKKVGCPLIFYHFSKHLTFLLYFSNNVSGKFSFSRK